MGSDWLWRDEGAFLPRDQGSSRVRQPRQHLQELPRRTGTQAEDSVWFWVRSVFQFVGGQRKYLVTLRGISLIAQNISMTWPGWSLIMEPSLAGVPPCHSDCNAEHFCCQVWPGCACSNTLWSCPTSERLETLSKLWDRVEKGGYLVLTETGTNAGSS